MARNSYASLPDAQALSECLRGAGAILLQADRRGRVDLKESVSSIVTQADLASEKFILDFLRKEFGATTVLSEEQGWAGENPDDFWIVDPLDGTSNFVAGLPWFGVMIARVKSSSVVLAGMTLPELGKLYIATKGQGTFLDQEHVQIPPGVQHLSECLCAVGFDSTSSIEQVGFLAQRTRNLRMTNSLADFHYALQGSFGAIVNFSVKPWDIAAASLLLSEAGWECSDFSGQEFRFVTGAEVKDLQFIATSPHLHEELLRAR